MPQIMPQGNWVRKWGFEAGSSVRVEYFPNKLVILVAIHSSANMEIITCLHDDFSICTDEGNGAKSQWDLFSTDRNKVQNSL